MFEAIKSAFRCAYQQKVQRSLFVVLGAFSIAFCAAALIHRTHYLQGFAPSQHWIFGLVLLALICLLSTVKFSFHESTTTWLRWAVLCGLLVPFADLPNQVGLSIVAVVGVLAWSNSGWASALRERLAVAGMALFLSMFALTVYQFVDARWDDYQLFAYPLGWTMQLMGQDVVIEGSKLWLGSETATTEILASWDKFGGGFSVMCLVSIWTLGVMARIRKRELLLLTLLFGVYACMRTAAMLIGIVEGTLSVLWWDELATMVSYLPMALVAVVFLIARQPTVEDVSPAETTPLRTSLALGLVLMGVLLCSIGWLFTSPGNAKDGVVMIDECYSEWEWSEHPIETKTYGVKTVYSYYNMMQELGHYYDIQRNFEPITEAALKDVSVLILKTPTEYYPKADREAIWKFVEEGGGLWLIGDHTNIFGMNTNLNSVGQKYGVAFNPDSVIDPEANRQLYRPSVGAHPIVRRLNLFLWYTGDSLKAPWTTRDVILSDRLLIDSPDYSVNTFFGDFRANLSEKVGPVVQAVAIESGKGRVAAWSDSTLFSNFSIFMPGKMELAMGYVDWLNRTNSLSWLRPTCLILGCLLIAAFFVAFRQCASVAVFGCWSGVGLAMVIIPIFNEWSYPIQEPDQDIDYVAFYEPDSVSSHYPLLTTFNEPTQTGYLNCTVAVQRVGRRPRLTSSMQQAVESDTIVWVSPKHSLNDADHQRLERFVDQGGTLILLDVGAGEEEVVDRVTDTFEISLKRFDVSTSSQKLVQAIQEDETKIPSWAKQLVQEQQSDPTRDWPYLKSAITQKSLNKWSVRYVLPESQALIVSDQGQPVVGTYQFGNGKVIVAGTDSLFSDLSLGACSSVPDGRQLELLQLLFSWFRNSDSTPNTLAQKGG